jgi:hypothetical protein
VDQAHGAGPGLIQSGKQYASRVAQESKKIRESTRTLQTLQGMKESGLKVSLFFSKTFCLKYSCYCSLGSAEWSEWTQRTWYWRQNLWNQKPIEALRCIVLVVMLLLCSNLNISDWQTAKIKAEARLECLHAGGGKLFKFTPSNFPTNIFFMCSQSRWIPSRRRGFDDSWIDEIF